MNILSQQIMSENEEGDEDQELLVKTKQKTKKLRLKRNVKRKICTKQTPL